MESKKEVEGIATNYRVKTFKTQEDFYEFTYKELTELCEKDFKAGYLQAQKDMIEEASGEFEEWWGKMYSETCNTTDYPDTVLANSVMQIAERAFTAGRLSGLKERGERIKELERELFRMNQFRKTGAICDDSDFPIAKQLKQGE
jgi:hypothetical protein